MAQQYLHNDAGGDGNEQIVAAVLNPLMSPRRGAQTMAAPVVDDIATVSIFHGKMGTAPETMVFSTIIAPFIKVPRRGGVAFLIHLAPVVVPIRFRSPLIVPLMRVSTVVVAI